MDVLGDREMDALGCLEMDIPRWMLLGVLGALRDLETDAFGDVCTWVS